MDGLRDPACRLTWPTEWPRRVHVRLESPALLGGNEPGALATSAGSGCGWPLEEAGGAFGSSGVWVALPESMTNVTAAAPDLSAPSALYVTAGEAEAGKGEP